MDLCFTNVNEQSLCNRRPNLEVAQLFDSRAVRQSEDDDAVIVMIEKYFWV
jgi:hypothetical protein